MAVSKTLIAGVRGKDTLDGRIDAAIKGSSNVAVVIHQVAVECLQHFADHGDLSKAERLCNGIHTACRPNALRAWFVTYGPISYSAKTGKLTKDKSDTANPLNIETATATPYFIETKEQGVDKLLGIDDIGKAFGAIISRYEKALKEDKVEPASVEAVRLRIAAMNAFKANNYRTVINKVVEPVATPTAVNDVTLDATAELQVVNG